MTASLFPEPVRRRHEEDDLQRSVVRYLRLALPDDALAFAIPNGGKRSEREARRLVGLGVHAGIPDLEIIHRGSPLFVELKTARGVLSEHQRLTHRQLIYCGAPVLVCRSLGCVEESLRELGVPLRGHCQ